MTIAPGEWGRIEAAAKLFVTDDTTELSVADFVTILVDGRRRLQYAEAVESVDAGLSNGPLVETEEGVECKVSPRTWSETSQYPSTLNQRDYWVTWALDGEGRKRPRAPWNNGHAYPAEWRASLDEEDDPRTSFNEAERYAELRPADVRAAYGSPDDDPEPGNLKPGILLPTTRPERERRICLIDWDDVRNPDTGATHPIAAAYIEMFPGFVEISQSGEGLHQFVLGGLDPHHRRKFIEEVDEESFVGDDVPQVEMYDGGRHTAMTGRAVVGADGDVESGQALIDDAIERFGTGDRTTITEGAGPLPESKKGSFTGVNLQNRPDGRPACYQGVLKAREYSDEFDHLTNWELIGYAAMLGCAVGLEQSKILEDLRSHPTPGYGFDPGREPEEVRRVCEAVEEGNLHPPNAETLAARGLLPDGGACDCPLHLDKKSATTPVSAVPIQQLAALDPTERKRAARKRGYNIPETEAVQDRVAETVDDVLRGGRMSVVEAPTGAGKSYHASTTPWNGRPDVAGDQPVVLLTGTQEHRDQNADKSHDAEVEYRQLRGRIEACACAAGEHDPQAAEEAEENLQPVTVNGEPISQWFDFMCERKGIPFSVAHQYAQEQNDQGVDLPCTADGTECLAIAQWENVPRDNDGNPTVDVIHATHQFAMVPSLRMSANVIFDELPDFTIDIGQEGMTQDRIHRMVAAFLEDADALVSTWEAFVGLATAPHDTDAGREAQELESTIMGHVPGVDWYFDEPDAHTLAPALTRAIWYALRGDADANGRRCATVPHEPPRLDRNAGDRAGWNREWIQVVLDEQNRVTKLWESPDLSQARSVVGLDARPAMPRWQLNVNPNISRERVLDDAERALWRFFKQQKTVVQVGEATRPFTSGEYFDEQGTRTILEHMTEEHGDVAVITAAGPGGSVERKHREILEDCGVDDPNTMHYGEEKSREDFADERAMLVNGVIDPGDDMVLDLLAALDQDATPETKESADGDEQRAHGRGFVGPDADTAEAILESVRGNHVAQAVGRSARNPESDERAIVYVRTDVAPPDLIDFEVPGVEWVYGDKQREILEYLRSNPGASAREIAENTDASKEHVRQTLQQLDDRNILAVREGGGDYGADEFRLADDCGEQGIADLEIANSPVWESYTFELAIRSVPLQRGMDSPETGAGKGGPNASLASFGPVPPD